MRVSKEKCHIPLLGWSNLMHQYLLGAAQLESGLAEEALGVLADTKLKMSHDCALMANNANSFLSCIAGGLKVVLQLCLALVRPQPERWVQLWAVQKRGTCWSKSRRTMGMVKGLKYLM